MQYRTDPKSGNKLSALGFGCMRFARGITAQIDMDKAEKLIMSAIERGVNFFDTAYIYGGSEEVLGAVLHKNKSREKIYISTKLPFQQCKTSQDFERLFQTQLERLKTDYIDYYLIHNLSEPSHWQRLCGLGIERWLAEKKASGQIRQIGFSSHGTTDRFETLLEAYDWDTCLIQYNYMNVNYQVGHTGLRKAYEKGLSIIIMEPLLGGRLATGLPQKAAKLFKETDAKLTPAAWAFRWLWNQPEVTVVLSGMNTAAQLDENIKTAENSFPCMFSEKEASLFAPVVAAFEEAYKIPCTGCNYCLPCPHDVNIPGSFAAYNISYALGYITGLIQYLTSSGMTDPKKNHGAHKCVGCGKCERHCPQNIKIADSLSFVTKRMEPWWVRALLGLAVKLSK